LSSPLSSRSIFTVRLAAITVGSASIYLFFLSPFAHVGLVLGQFRWLGIYPSIIGMAAFTASVAMLMTLGLVRVLGVRRTRVVAQILGALSGALFFLMSQLYSTALRDLKDRAAIWLGPMLAPGAALGPDSLVWLPGQAVLGSPWPLLLLSLLALAVFLLTVRFTHRFFVHGVQQAVSMVRANKAPAGGPRFHFGRSLARTVMIKEWRLIARDPQLISQVLLQLLYLVPLCALVFAKGAPSLPGIGAALCFVCGSLASALAWVIISAEDAPDLLRAAPCSPAIIRRAKLAAVAIPPLLLIALPVFWLALGNPLAGAIMATTIAGAVCSPALIILWLGRPAPRSNFKTRAKGNFLCNTAEILSGFAWAGISYLLLAHY
jgi:ABC-2 type transport system permease protein